MFDIPRILFDSPYTRMMMPRIKPGRDKKFGETCPKCGAERKTLYWQSGEWKCLKCCKKGSDQHE